MSEPAPNPDRGQTDRLIKQYVEDRLSLSAEELDQLIEALRAQPALAIELRTQLLLDDLLAQKLAFDRRNFLAQVGQRIGDFEQGEEEIYSQVSELRALAEAELVEKPQHAQSSRWTMAIVAVLAVTLATLAFLAPQYWPVAPRTMAEVRDVHGDVFTVKGEQRSLVRTGDSVSTGILYEVVRGAHVRIEFRDKTTVEFGSGTKFQLVADRKSQAKLVQVDQGEVVAHVMPQRDLGPMVFNTPHARAIVVGTELRLIIEPEQTRLDVTEGQVDFERLAGGSPLRVAAHQSGVANQTGLVLRSLQWPDSEDRLLFTFHDSGIPHVRNPETGNPRETPLEERGPVRTIHAGEVYAFDGGSYYSPEAGEDLVANIRGKGAFTIETIVIPDSVYRVKNARILALGDDGEMANFQLLQRNNDLIFKLWTDGSKEPQELKLGEVKPDRAVHVAIAYDGHKLVGYLNGVATSELDNIRSGLATWNTGALSLGSDAGGKNVWRGLICGLAITDHALADFEVVRSAGQYQTLYARRDAGLMWDNLMADDLDPTRFAGAGNWQIVDDSWESEAVADAWFGFGPDDLKNYDLLVDVNWVEGDGPLKMTLPIAKRPVSVVLGKSGGEQKTALQDMGGQPMTGTGSMESEHSLPQGRTARVEVKVRLLKDLASLDVTVDGQPWLDWKGSPDKLPEVVSTNLPALKKPVLVTAGNVVRIEALKIRDLNRMATSAIGQ
ncbi:FecR protein [Anatilimnocola aggregata]|uniref:FecR protein n=1 Tax=Anatilimnocola aggregata TaxID=2528021 RepID=A0A517Y7U1_9BACT|nr:LamG-like jellyroll fold domain-containing protein [Anatilimnocola aggregata]QDU26307.1 FecR protein [Anatilimnocola aggregata]